MRRCLERTRNPLLIFASSGDNITPPHQALNWSPEIYPTTEAFMAAGQRIVYLLNPHVGHLSIFVLAMRAHRRPVYAGNPWLVGEAAASRMILDGLDAYRRWRDEIQEALFL